MTQDEFGLEYSLQIVVYVVTKSPKPPYTLFTKLSVPRNLVYPLLLSHLWFPPCWSQLSFRSPCFLTPRIIWERCSLQLCIPLSQSPAHCTRLVFHLPPDLSPLPLLLLPLLPTWGLQRILRSLFRILFSITSHDLCVLPNIMALRAMHILKTLKGPWLTKHFPWTPDP